MSCRAADALESLLAEPIGAARVRESSRFDVISGGVERPIVLLGCGRLGLRTLSGLRAEGREVIAFTDNASETWGRVLEGVPVLAPHEAVRRYGDDAVFVVTIWRAEGGFQTAALCDGLKALGCKRVARLGELYWAFPERFLPYFAMDRPSRALAEADSIRAALAMFDDAPSRSELVEQVRWRLWLDADGLGAVSSGPIYFPPDLVRLRDDEVFVDAGAFDGDTVRAFVVWSGGSFRRVVAIEPDPRNRVRLAATIDAIGRLPGSIDVVPVALGARDGSATFLADGTGAARLSRGEGITVPVRRLASIPHGEDVTFFKLDIEGAEPAAIDGAAEVIARRRPILAVSVYHVQDHLWRLPLRLREIVPDGYRWALRAHAEEGFDLVLYGIPQERAIERSREGDWQ